jgi:succinate dehydrogenase / fumarate reductase cytochrome b subunit
MTLTKSIFGTTLGRKFLMAVTGIILIAFIIGHLVGNLQIFEDPDRINGYAQFLHSLGPALWVVRGVLLVSAVVHIWAAAVLTLEARRARGAEGYASPTWIQATLSSRYMRWTGVVVLAFIAYHLAQFTLGFAQADSFKENLPVYVMQGDYRVLGFTTVHAGAEVADVRSMVIRGFGNPWVALFYIVAVGLLSIHLLHGADSLFQTLGWRNRRWAGGLRAAVTIGCALYFLGNLSIPGAVLAGFLTPAVPTQTALAGH